MHHPTKRRKIKEETPEDKDDLQRTQLQKKVSPAGRNTANGKLDFGDCGKGKGEGFKGRRFEQDLESIEFCY